MSLDSFAEGIVNKDPSIYLKLNYEQNVAGDTTFDKTRECENKLSLTIDRLVDIDSPANCHMYISIVLLPDAKKELKQKTSKGTLMIGFVNYRALI